MQNNEENNFTPNANSTLSSPANQSLRQSYYIAALDRYLGIRGLISPVVDTKTNLTYDFFHPESQRLIKFFRSLELDVLNQYEAHRPEPSPLYILDTDNMEKTNCEGPQHLCNLGIETHLAVTLLGAYLYRDDRLFELDDDGLDDEIVDDEEMDDDEMDISAQLHCAWYPLAPIERTKCIDLLMDADED